MKLIDSKLVCTLLMAIALLGCRKVDTTDTPKEQPLVPIDVTLVLDNHDGTKFHTKSLNANFSNIITESKGWSVEEFRKPIDLVATKASGVPSWVEVGDTISNKRIDDLHVFLVHKDRDTIVRHYYKKFAQPLAPDDVELKNIYVGNYYIYMVANLGDAITIGGAVHKIELGVGENYKVCYDAHTKAQIEELMYKLSLFNINDFAKGFPRTYTGEVLFKTNKEEYPGDKIVLRPAMSRITFKMAYQLANVSNLKFNQISISSVYLYSHLFGENNTSAMEHLNDKFGSVTIRGAYENVEKYSKIINPNRPGLPLVTGDTPGKIPSNAPTNATYINFKGTYSDVDGEHNIGYMYYLGGDDVNDYNVERDADYFLSFNFKDPNFDDPRIYSFNVPKNWFKTAGGSTIYDEGTASASGTITKLVEVKGKNINSKVEILCYPESGQEEYGTFAVYKYNGTDWVQIGSSGQKVTCDVATNAEVNNNQGVQLKVEYTRGGMSSSGALINLHINVKTTNPAESISVGQKLKFEN